jgi:NADH dehydrogenase [ubiquinone] 1 alpha subcomplex assembly factor 5
VGQPLFDQQLRQLRRDRAFRLGVETFLFDRAFADVLDSLAITRRAFRNVLLIGCPHPRYRDRLAEATAGDVAVFDPGPLFADAAGGSTLREDAADLPLAAFDLCVAFGTLDGVDDLPGALRRILLAMRPDGFLLGVLPGGETLPQLRSAMRAADLVEGSAAPHVHPRLEPSTLGGLLSACGFVMPVVEVDSVAVRYASLFDLVRDLRRMAATNLLLQRPRQSLSRAAVRAAAAHFRAAGQDERTAETIQLLHFAAWAPAEATGMRPS